MFTGIVEELGIVVGRDPTPTGAVLTIKGPQVLSDAREGDSIAVNGVCLTVRDKDADSFVADVMHETLRRTTVEGLAPGDPVNLERAATLATRLGGHLVQGHVDGVATVTEVTGGDEVDVRFEIPAPLARYLVPKGSVAVDGVSLTVVDVADTWLTVSLIPTTLRATTLGRLATGDRVNIETDVIAKYVARLVASGGVADRVPGEGPTDSEVTA